MRLNLAATVLGVVFILVGLGEGMAGTGSLAGKGIGLFAGMIYVLPILLLNLWSAQRLSPAVLSFLMTAEIISGVVSSALFLDEPFGAMQGAGAVLILFAASVEVIPALMRKGAASTSGE